MRTVDALTAVVLMLLAGVVIADSVRLGIGWGTDGPKSGFFPFWLAALMLTACALILIQSVRRPSSAHFVTREQLSPVLKVLWPAAAAVALMQFVGLYVASALYLAFYMRLVGRHGWLVVIGLAVLIPVATFFVFETWFLVPMPKGPLEAWLGY
jgi:putative tricarboxylic transport membrane protein